MSDEIAVIEDWIVTALTASTDVTDYVDNRIYSTPPPRGTEYPFIIYNMTSTNDVRGIGVSRIMSDTIYTVKAVARSSNATDLPDLVAAIDVALTLEIPAVSALGTVEACVRERAVQIAEFTEGQHYEHRGGDYKVHARIS
jgi:hypothetical protein